MANTFSVYTYSPKDVQLIISGYQISGWDSISISRPDKSVTIVKGIRGKHTRTINADTSALISVRLIQTVQSNDVLSEIHELDRQNGTGRLTLTLKDLSGRSVFSSNEAFITGYPTVTFSGNFEYRLWSIFCQTTSPHVVGGNSRPTTSILDSATEFVTGLF